VSGGPTNESELEERLSRPTPELIEVLRRHAGDLLILGAGGKMGPTLAVMARRALGPAHEVIAVSRFSNPAARERLGAAGVRTIEGDLRDPETVGRLPDAPHIVFMAGQKFGTERAPRDTWVMNVVVPGYVAYRFPRRRLVVFSTGNVYPLAPAGSPGPSEADPVGPIGEYAQSCLARERIFEDAADRLGTSVAIARLNYAIDLRYGVLLDIGRRVLAGEPVPVAMGYVNVIWQGDANDRALRCLALASRPPTIVNVTGEKIGVRQLAQEFGRRLGRPPRFAGTEAADALLSDASRSLQLFGPPLVDLDTMIEWTSEWLLAGRPTLDKPTRFEARDGQF